MAGGADGSAGADAEASSSGVSEVAASAAPASRHDLSGLMRPDLDAGKGCQLHSSGRGSGSRADGGRRQ